MMSELLVSVFFEGHVFYGNANHVLSRFQQAGISVAYFCHDSMDELYSFTSTIGFKANQLKEIQF